MSDPNAMVQMVESVVTATGRLEMPETIINDIQGMTDAKLARLAFDGTKDQYAKSYLAHIMRGMEGETLRVQWLYALNNLTTWRGGVARLVKAEIKRRHGMK